MVTCCTVVAAALVGAAALWAIHCWLAESSPRGAIRLAAVASRKTLDACLPQRLRSSLSRSSVAISPRGSVTASDLAAAWAAAAAAASSAGSSKPGWTDSAESSENLDKYGSMEEGLGKCQLSQLSLTWQPTPENDPSLSIDAIGSLGERPYPWSRSASACSCSGGPPRPGRPGVAALPGAGAGGCLRTAAPLSVELHATILPELPRRHRPRPAATPADVCDIQACASKAQDFSKGGLEALQRRQPCPVVRELVECLKVGAPPACPAAPMLGRA